MQAARLHPAVHFHQLRRALGLPQVLLRPRQLHAHRLADGTGEQQRIAAHIIGAVAAIAAGRLIAADLDGLRRQIHQHGQITAQHVRVLRAGPDHRLPLRPVGNGAGRADGAVLVIGPDIGALARHIAFANATGKVAGLVQRAGRGGMVLQRLAQVAHVRQLRRHAPVHRQSLCDRPGLIGALRHHGQKIRIPHDGDEARHAPHGGFVIADKAVADEIAAVAPGIGRADDMAMHHAGHIHIVDIGMLAAQLLRQVTPPGLLADDAVLRRGLDCGAAIQRQVEAQTLQKLGIGEALALPVGESCLKPQLIRRGVEAAGGLGSQNRTGLRGGKAQGDGGHLNGFGGNRRPLIRRQRRVAQHHAHGAERQIQLFGNDLRQRRLDAGAKIHMAVEAGGAAVCCKMQIDGAAIGPVLVNDKGRGGGAHDAPPRMSSAARSIEAMISRWVPQRHRLWRRAARISSREGEGLSARRAVAVITMPLRQ